MFHCGPWGGELVMDDSPHARYVAQYEIQGKHTINPY